MTCAILCFTPTTFVPPQASKPLFISSHVSSLPPPPTSLPLAILVSSSSTFPVVAFSVHAPRGACEWYNARPRLIDDLLQNILSDCFSSVLAGNPIVLSEQPARAPRLHSYSFRPLLIAAVLLSFLSSHSIEFELENQFSNITAGPSPSFAPTLCPATALWLCIS